MGVSKRAMTAVWALILMAMLALSMTVLPTAALAKSDSNLASGGTPVSYKVTGVTPPAPAPAPTPQPPTASTLPVLNDNITLLLWALVALAAGTVAFYTHSSTRRALRRL